MNIIKNIAKKLLFIRKPENPNRPKPVDMSIKTVFIFLKRKDNISRKKFFKNLLTSVKDRVHEMDDEINFTSFKQFHDVSLNGVITAPYMFTRSPKYTKFLCNLRSSILQDESPVPYRPYFDCAIEFQFSSQLNSTQVLAIKELSEELKEIAKRVSYVESNQRILRYKDDSLKSSNPIWLIEFLRRLPEFTRNDAQEYWKGDHGNLIVDNAADYIKFKEYYQIHGVSNTEANFKDEFEGFAFVKFPSLGSYIKASLRPNTLRFNNELVVDECRFVQPVYGMLYKEYDFSIDPTPSSK